MKETKKELEEKLEGIRAALNKRGKGDQVPENCELVPLTIDLGGGFCIGGAYEFKEKKVNKKEKQNDN